MHLAEQTYNGKEHPNLYAIRYYAKSNGHEEMMCVFTVDRPNEVTEMTRISGPLVFNLTLHDRRSLRH